MSRPLRIEYEDVHYHVMNRGREHSSGDALWTADARDARGVYTQSTLANGIELSRSFDPETGRLTGLSAGASGAVADFTYGWDTLGNLTSRNDGNTGLDETFTYDNLNRLSSAVTNGATRGAIYDDTGNITDKVPLGGTFPADVNTYNYPAAGQSRPAAVSSITGQVNGQTNPTFAYDANGNMTAGAGRSYTWNAFNKVDTVSGGGVTLGKKWEKMGHPLFSHFFPETFLYGKVININDLRSLGDMR